MLAFYFCQSLTSCFTLLDKFPNECTQSKTRTIWFESTQITCLFRKQQQQQWGTGLRSLLHIKLLHGLLLEWEWKVWRGQRAGPLYTATNKPLCVLPAPVCVCVCVCVFILFFSKRNLQDVICRNRPVIFVPAVSGLHWRRGGGGGEGGLPCRSSSALVSCTCESNQ